MAMKRMLLILACTIVTSCVVRAGPHPQARTQQEMNADCTKVLAQSFWEENTKPHLDSYKHILVISISGDHWEDGGPGRYWLHHFNANVTKAYKGDWKVGERIAIVHAVDAPSLTTSNAEVGSVKWVFTNQHTNSQIGLETGEFGNYGPYMERILQCVFP
jgi:hypothetical protein